MAVYAAITDRVVTNLVEASQQFADANSLVDVSTLPAGVGVGWSDASGTWTPPTAQPDPRRTAAADLQAMAATDLPTFQTQIQADANTITATGWANLDAATQQAILLRVVNGFGSVIQAIQTHALATGVLQ